ncbi:MAG: 2-hydroxyacyl-CoA dehydratase family protein [Clostridia bacterium]
MKDLKHMIYFENLLDSAYNELVRQAKEDGKKVIGYTCFHVPEVLLNVDNCFSVRLRAPKSGSFDMATYYMTTGTCEFARAILERSIEGGYNFIDALAGVDTCEGMNRCLENIEVQNLITGKTFFLSHADIPFCYDDDAVIHYTEQIKLKIMDKLKENLGTDISDAAIKKAVEEQNEVSAIITEIGNYRKELNPLITGHEFHILNLVSYTCPKKLIVDKLRETLEEIKTREADAKNKYRARVVVVGSEIDDPDLITLMEESGALVVADRFCYGSFPGRQVIELDESEGHEDFLTQVCRRYLKDSLCPRFMSQEKVKFREDFAEQLVKDYNADGIIYEQIKFCTYWGYERTIASYIMNNERNIPTLSIDRPYMSRTSGQLRTRVQAFVESLEIKKIKAARKAKERG